MASKSSMEALAAEKKLDVEPLDPVLEVNENIPSEVFDRPREDNEIEEISPRIFTLKTIIEPLTLESLKNAIYELGVVNLCWPEITEPVFETRTCFPKSYYTNSPKERLLLAYAENFRRQFHFHFNGRKPLLLQAPNECGLQKMVCTSIRPTKLCYADTSTWQGLAALVCDFFDYEPLTKPMLHMPSSAEGWMVIEEGYRSKFPHCLGSLEGKHVVIESPTRIVLWAVVDSQYRFTFADIESQERITDDVVFVNSLLWQRIYRNEIDFPPPCPLPGSDVNVPYVFVADGAFALSSHVMTPYPGNHVIGSPKRKFNEMLSRSRVVVDNTFGILTSVFGIFRRSINLNPKTVSIITMTCVLLHNYLRKSETSSNRYTPPGSFDVYDNNGTLIKPGLWRRHDNEHNAMKTLPSISRRSSLNAQQIREEFTSYFYRNI